MSDDTAFDALVKRAEGIARDISGMEPLEGEQYDTSYDLYVEELDDKLYGVIDMGDCYHEVFEWQDGEWEHALAPSGSLATNYAFEITDRILAVRRGGGW